MQTWGNMRKFCQVRNGTAADIWGSEEDYNSAQAQQSTRGSETMDMKDG